jgi:hypothetical protein
MARRGRCCLRKEDVILRTRGLQEMDTSSEALETARLAADVPVRHTSPQIASGLRIGVVTGKQRS